MTYFKEMFEHRKCLSTYGDKALGMFSSQFLIA